MYMNQKKYKLYYILIGIFVIISVILLAIFLNLNKQHTDLKDKYTNINVPNKKSVPVEVTPKEVNEYKNHVNDKLDSYLQNNLKEGQYNEENDGVAVIRGLFSLTGGKVITNKTPHKDVIKYYEPFDYRLSNFSAEKKDDGSYTIFSNIEIKYDGKKVNEHYDLFELSFDKNGNMTGGHLYGSE